MTSIIITLRQITKLDTSKSNLGMRELIGSSLNFEATNDECD